MWFDAWIAFLLFVLVNRHRWTGRYEAHLWDKSTWNQNQNKKGKQGLYPSPPPPPSLLYLCNAVMGILCKLTLVFSCYCAWNGWLGVFFQYTWVYVTGFILFLSWNMLMVVFFIFVGFIKFYLFAGAYDDEEAAARAYDLAALKYWGPGTLINFPVR